MPERPDLEYVVARLRGELAGAEVRELARLHASIAEVLGVATRTIAARRPPLPDKLRDFLSVRGRAGAPCPRCGAKIRRAGVRGHDACFCPECQPDERLSGLVDWRKLRRD